MIPKTVKILGKTWKVKVKESYIEDEFAGLCDDENRIIYVSLAENAIQTFYHELIHAIIFEAALNQTELTSDIQEIICEQVAKVLDDNFKLTQKKQR